MKRLFIGLPLTPECQREVSVLVAKLQKKRWKVKWEPEAKWHLTLVFLGEVQVREALKQMKKIEEKEFRLKLKGLGRFPEIMQVPRFGERLVGRTAKRIRLYPKDEMRLPKIIYLALKGDLQSLHQLHRNLVIEEVPFRPHITIGKIKSESSRGEKLEIAKEIEKLRYLNHDGDWLVDRVCLYESTLKPDGSVYKIINEVKLEPKVQDL